MDRDLLKGWLDAGMSLPKIGALTGRDPSTVGYWVKKHGLVANGNAKHAPRGGLDRDQLAAVAAAGLTLRQMAAKLGVSTGTIQYWLDKHQIDRRRRWRRREARAAAAAGRKRMTGYCASHGDGDFVIYADGRTRCARCNIEAVTRRRRKVKAILVDEAGGKCVLCGYDRHVGALHFHHLDPKLKRFSLSHDGATVSLSRSRAEAQKCVLLCANCHAEVEGGIASLS